MRGREGGREGGYMTSSNLGMLQKMVMTCVKRRKNAGEEERLGS